MNRRGKPRKFPYYIVTEIDSKELRMQILDLNTIQKEEYQIVDGKEKKVITYVSDKNQHDLKWIDVPGATKSIQQKTVKWIMDMVFPDGERHKDKYMVYYHKSHFNEPLHEENKVNVFRQWEDENLFSLTVITLDEDTEENDS